MNQQPIVEKNSMGMNINRTAGPSVKTSSARLPTASYNSSNIPHAQNAHEKRNYNNINNKATNLIHI
jgi:hypothetical protein